jgi:hypothetical protein
MERSDAGDFAVAVLDFRLGVETVSPVARRLAKRGVPFILHAGQARHEPGMAEWSECSTVERPVPPHELISAVRAALAN